MWAGKSQGLDYEFLGDFISENNGSKNNGELKLQVSQVSFLDNRLGPCQSD